jgi:hypothetical protein
MSQAERAILKRVYQMLPGASKTSKADLMRIIRMIESGSHLHNAAQ